MLDPTALVLLAVIVTALAFDFTNGFHDTSNAIATSVSTRALRPRRAVLLSAALNLAGAIITTQLLNAKVANTIGSLIGVKVALPVIIAALAGAISWNLITWRLGLPSSSSHALIGGLLGAGMVGYGVHAIKWNKVEPVVISLVASPVIGLLLGFVVMTALYRLFRRARPGPTNRGFRALQVVSASFVSFSHGANDAQKTMAIIALALLSTGHLKRFAVPVWVVGVSAAAISLGTYAGGWRIIRTLGTRIMKLEPINGFAAETTASAVIQGATQFGLPVSTTHCVSGAVMGVGATKRLSAVRWGVARTIVAAWVLTIPAAGLMAGALTLIARQISI